MNKDKELEKYCVSHTDCGNRCDKCEAEKRLNDYKHYDEWFDDDFDIDYRDEEFNVF